MVAVTLARLAVVFTVVLAVVLAVATAAVKPTQWLTTKDLSCRGQVQLISAILGLRVCHLRLAFIYDHIRSCVAFLMSSAVVPNRNAVAH